MYFKLLKKGGKAVTSARPTAFIVLLFGSRDYSLCWEDTGRKVIRPGFYDYDTYPMCDGRNLTSFQSPTNKLGIKKNLLQSCELNEVMNVKSSAL